MKLKKTKIFKKGYTNEILPFPQELEFHNKLHTELPMPKQIPNYETPEQMHCTYRIQQISDTVNTKKKSLYILQQVNPEIKLDINRGEERNKNTLLGKLLVSKVCFD